MKRDFTRIFIIILILSPVLWVSLLPASAQSPDGKWSDFVNISNTPTASTFPCVAADIAGNIHALWSEDVGGKTKNLLFNHDGSPQLTSQGNQINYLTDTGNTLYYSRWNGQTWLEPVDIQINPFGKIQYPEAIVDAHGVLHVVWASTQGSDTKLFYSSAFAGQAESARAWSRPVELADPILFALYPVDISVDVKGGLHVLYSKLGLNPGAYIINSFDGGNTWSTPIQLYITSDENGVQEGVSNIRLVADKKGRLHATWTRYDVSGNGRAIFYSQSRDQGKSWTEPFEVATWQPGWYEVDWLNVGIVEDEIHLVWEGSSPVAAQVERISHDGGLIWGESNFFLPNIVGENGFADLVTDSDNQLHLLVVKRGDAASLSNGIWYTTWEEGHWQDPILLGTTDNSLYATAGDLDPQTLQDSLRGTFTGGGLRYQKSAIVNGNELFTIVVNEWDGDIWSSHTTLSAPMISPHPFPPPTSTPTLMPTPTSTPEFQETTQTTALPQLGGLPSSTNDPTNLVLLGALPAILVIVGFLTFVRIFKHNH